MKRKNQKGIVPIIFIIAIVIALGVALVLQMQKNKTTVLETNSNAVPEEYRQLYQSAADDVAPIENSDDLSNASAELDNTSTSQMDAELNNLESLSNF